MIIYSLIFCTIFTIIGINEIPRTIGILQPMMLLLAAGGTRFLGRYWLGGHYRDAMRKATRNRLLIYGAGKAGQQLAGALSSDDRQMLLGYLDDNRQIQGQSLDGRPVYDPGRLPALMTTIRPTDVLLAMPSAPRQRRIQIVEELRKYPLHVRTLPSMGDLISGKIAVSDVKELDIEDLLGRSSVTPAAQLLKQHITGKAVLVTGAGGSIGSELCRQILTLAPSHLLLVEISEYALYQIHEDLQQIQNALSSTGQTVLTPLLASVQNHSRMNSIFATWKPDTVYHAAAYKHVPLVEHNPLEGLQNNVWGTKICAELAIQHEVKNFVLISTDKAVRPTNTMGASKRLAELILQALAKTCTVTKFCMVRFGNVLGSSGSVVPLFRRQIRAGGPITVTHQEITRYFMTVEEAAQLVIQAAALADGGDVFVLDMGEPVRILDLARRMIELSGLRVKDKTHSDGDIEITFTGLRPGEKLYEELLIGANPQRTEHPRILKAQEEYIPWIELANRLEVLRRHLDNNNIAAARLSLTALVPGFNPNSEIVDWIYLSTTEI